MDPFLHAMLLCYICSYNISHTFQALDTLQLQISDGSLGDIYFPDIPSDVLHVEIKKELEENIDPFSSESLKKDDDKIDIKPNFDVEPFKCEMCGLGFSQNEHRMKHILMVHEKAMAVHGDKKLFKCKICDKSYLQKKNLNAHILKIHENMKKMRKSTWKMH